MSDAEARVPVDVLTGFLGSGKTTLVRRLVESGVLADTAILVNEFAGLPVDQRLIGLSGGKAAVLGERCLCCVVDGNLRMALLGLLEARASGAVPPFRRILVEMSGIADPTPLLAALASDRMLKPRLRLGHVVTLVDLCHAEATLAESDEAISQIVAADRICLTKRDLAAPDASVSIGMQLAALNPLARILVDEAADNPFRADETFGGAALPRSAFQASAPAPTRHGALRATILRSDAPVEWAAFATWLSLLVHRHGKKLLRIKGTVRLAGEAAQGPIVIQSVRHIVHMPEHVPGGSGAAGAELVVIGHDLDAAALLRSFDAFVVAPPESRLKAAG